MTHDKWTGMSFRERNVWLHYKVHPEDAGKFDLDYCYAAQPPDYMADLNVIGLAYYQAITTGVQQLEYMRCMTDEILKPVAEAQGEQSWIGTNNDLEALHNATAAQRAEALALTLEPEE